MLIKAKTWYEYGLDFPIAVSYDYGTREENFNFLV